MIDLIRKYFGKSGGNGPSDQREEKSHDIRIATCALFLEMSNIDGEFSEGEKERILNILKRDYQLSDEHATELMEVSNGELKGSIDLWQFTNLINKNYSLEEKLKVIETVEDYLVHKLAKLLRLTHKQLIEAKLKVKRSGP
ncbi:MAG: TerB family tellurite resistance protein [Deltaproteobacteria bacterium]|nr:TerB family tellurite resistance protein [Deltaproteobacteria bacterium]